MFNSRHRDSLLQLIVAKTEAGNYKFIDEVIINTNPNISIVK